MPVQSSVAGHQVGAGSVQQVYFTHCLREDSINLHPGYSIRATSVNDNPELLRFVSTHCSYELPLGMWGPTEFPPGTAPYRLPAEAPCRLARLQTSSGVALIHTAHLPFDTCAPPRPNSFFSHVLLFQTLSPLEALKTWGSADWVREYPTGKTQELKPLTGPPRPGPLSDEALTRFLTKGATPPNDQQLATLIWPDRPFLKTAEERRLLLSLFLQGCHQALSVPEGGPRSRLYVLAEPGLTALLLYGAMRLLPQSLVAGLTFSTYENSHRALHEYKLARVVGTYVPVGDKGLSSDFMNSRGFGIDTFSMRHSPELKPEGTASLNRLLDLATAGKYERIKDAYGLGNGTVNGFAEGLRLLELDERLARGETTVEELESLVTTEAGRKRVERHQEAIWPVVREGSLNSKSLRQAFDDLLHRKVPELKSLAVGILSGKSQADWQAHWERLAGLDKNHKTLLEALVNDEECRPVALRLPLLVQWFALAGTEEKSLPEKIEELLQVLTETELTQFAAAVIPPRWLGLTLLWALGRDDTSAVAASLLAASDGAVFGEFCRELAHDEPNVQMVELRKVAPLEGKEEDYVDRLLRAGLHPVALNARLKDLGAYDRDNWLPWWLSGGRLGSLLKLAAGEAAAPVWEAFTCHLNKSLLVEDDKQQNKLLDQLDKAVQAGKEAAPKKANARISQWSDLRRHFRDPQPPKLGSPKKLKDLCKKRTKLEEPLPLLQERFGHLVQKGGDSEKLDNSEKEELDRFIEVCHGFQEPLTDENPFWKGYLPRFRFWLQVVAACQDEQRQEKYVKHYLFSKHVPPEWREHAKRENSRNPVVAKLELKGMSVTERIMWIICASLVVIAGAGGVMGTYAKMKSSNRDRLEEVERERDDVKERALALQMQIEKLKKQPANPRDKDKNKDQGKTVEPKQPLIEQLRTRLETANKLVRDQATFPTYLKDRIPPTKTYQDLAAALETGKASSVAGDVETFENAVHDFLQSEIVRLKNERKAASTQVAALEEKIEKLEAAKPMGEPEKARKERLAIAKKRLDNANDLIKDEPAFGPFLKAKADKAEPKDYKKLSKEIQDAKKDDDVEAAEKAVQQFERIALAFVKAEVQIATERAVALIVKRLELLEKLCNSNKQEEFLILQKLTTSQKKDTGKLKMALQDPKHQEDAMKLVEALVGFIDMNWPFKNREALRIEFRQLLGDHKETWQKIGAEKELEKLLTEWKK